MSEKDAHASVEKQDQDSSPYRILSLDGGGSKGFYTLGVLREIEGLIQKPLSEHFHLVFGTSTGAIIAALIGLGYRISDIESLYKEHVPAIMKARTPQKKSAALNALSHQIFQDKTFDEFKTDIGLVAVKWRIETPMIFKNNIHLSYERLGTFVPGFGCTIADAVEASCSAFPFFLRKTVRTSEGDAIELVDGGYCANNPTLYAIAAATVALKIERQRLRVVNVGVGQYPDPQHSFIFQFIKRLFLGVQLLQKTMEINTQSMEKLRSILYADIPSIRISDTFETSDLATSFLEYDLNKLNLLHQLGRESYANHEKLLQEIVLR